MNGLIITKQSTTKLGGVGGKGYFAAHGDKPCVCFSYCSPFMGGRVSQSSQVLVHFFVCVLVTVFRVWEAVPPDQTKVQPQHLLSWHTSKPVVKCIHAQQMWDDFQSLTTRCYGTKSFQNTSLLIIQLPRLKKDLSGRIMITEKIVKSECSLLHWLTVVSYDWCRFLQVTNTILNFLRAREWESD